MVEELGIFRPDVLEVNPSFMAAFCRYVNRKGLKPRKPGLITYTYENASALHLREMARAFPGVPLSSSYGTTETGYVFTECEQGRFHQNSDYCRVDFQPFKPEHGGSLLGRILVTTFHNPWYMILKFTVGDIVLLDPAHSCPCGRNSGLVLSSIQGRFSDCTLTTDGRLVTMKALDQAMSPVENLTGYKLLQTAGKNYRVTITTADNRGAETAASVRATLTGLYGAGADIDIRSADYLEPEHTGKYRLSGSLLPLLIDDFLATPTGARA
jgi:phenylacetate-CoA ligase